MLIKAALTQGVQRPRQSDWAAFNRARLHDLEKLNDRLIAGQLNPQEWYEAFGELLLDGHAGAGALGRQRSGNMDPLGIDDFLRARRIVDGEEADFLLGFLDALENQDPRYWDAEAQAFRASTVGNRSRLYVGKMRGTAGEAFVAASPEEAEFEWVLGAAEHCPDCPVLASMSPWTKTTLWTAPGSGDTQCICITSPDARIFTRRGDIPISAVAVGDEVWTHRGRWRKVIATPRNEPMPDHRQAWIEAPTGVRVGCTSDHRFFTQRGWESAANIANARLPVYTVKDAKALRAMFPSDANRPQRKAVQAVLRDLRMWAVKGLSRGFVPGLRKPIAGKGSMGYAVGAPSGRTRARWDQAAAAICRSCVAIVLHVQASRWQGVRILLGRSGEAALYLPLSVGLGTGERSDSGGHDNSPRQRRPDRRQDRESANALKEGAWSFARLRRTFSKRRSSSGRPVDRQDGIRLPNLRGEVSELSARPESAKVLLEGVLAPGTTLYDLTVEDDASFFIEGLCAHNSNCLCHLHRLDDGITSFKPT